MFIRKIGIDLGTANTLVFVPKKGVVINEPSVVAVSRDDNRVLAVGFEGRDMIGIWSAGAFFAIAPAAAWGRS